MPVSKTEVPNSRQSPRIRPGQGLRLPAASLTKPPLWTTGSWLGAELHLQLQGPLEVEARHRHSPYWDSHQQTSATAMVGFTPPEAGGGWMLCQALS